MKEKNRELTDQLRKEIAANRKLADDRRAVKSVPQPLPRDGRADDIPSVTLDFMGIRKAEAEAAAEKAAREAKEKEIQGYKDRQAARIESMKQREQESRERRLSRLQATTAASASGAHKLVSLSDAPPVPTLQQQQALDYLRSHRQAPPPKPPTHMIVAGEKPVRGTGQAGGGDDLNTRVVALHAGILNQAAAAKQAEEAGQAAERAAPAARRNSCSFWKGAMVVTGTLGAGVTSFAVVSLLSLGATSALLALLVAGIILLAAAGLTYYMSACTGNNKAVIAAPTA